MCGLKNACFFVSPFNCGLLSVAFGHITVQPGLAFAWHLTFRQCGMWACFLCWMLGDVGGTNTLALQLVDTIIYRYDYIPKPCLVIV